MKKITQERVASMKPSIEIAGQEVRASKELADKMSKVVADYTMAHGSHSQHSSSK